MITIDNMIMYHNENPNIKLTLYTNKLSDLDILEKTNVSIIKASTLFQSNTIKHYNILDISYNGDIELTIHKKAKLICDIINLSIRPEILINAQEKIIEGILTQLYSICKTYLDKHNDIKACMVAPTFKDIESRLSVYPVGTDGYYLNDIMSQIGLFDDELCKRTNIDTDSNFICFLANGDLFENIIWQLIYDDFVYNLRLDNPKEDILSKIFINGKTK